MKKNNITISILVISGFLLAYFGSRLTSGFTGIQFASDYLRIAYHYFWWIVPPALVVGFLFGFENLPETTGLKKGFLFGFGFALVTVSPMLISSALVGSISDDFRLFSLLKGTLFAGFMEEFLFRAFLFGLLFRKAGWGFVPAGLAGALIFGMGHLYQGSTFVQAAGIFAITAMGALWFAWLYIEWDSLWVPVFLHVFMNLSWTLFEVSENALGGVNSNIFRIITIALTVVFTILSRRKAGLKINRKTLWVNRDGICKAD